MFAIVRANLLSGKVVTSLWNYMLGGVFMLGHYRHHVKLQIVSLLMQIAVFGETQGSPFLQIQYQGLCKSSITLFANAQFDLWLFLIAPLGDMADHILIGYVYNGRGISILVLENDLPGCIGEDGGIIEHHHGLQDFEVVVRSLSKAV